MVAPFQIKDCALIVRVCDILPAMNLREMRERISRCPPDSLYHHYYEAVLRPSFDDPEYHNDFALWAARGLHDFILAERLEMVYPYAFADIELLRGELLDIIGDRLSETYYVPWALNDKAFYFQSATTVIFKTNHTIDQPEQLCDAISQMTTGSLYYHFWEARRRTPDRTDDFSEWLMDWDDLRRADIIESLSGIDFYFMSLKELQATLCETLEKISGRKTANEPA